MTKPKTPKKPKSLGALDRPTLEVKHFDDGRGEVWLEIATDKKRVRVKANYYYFAKRLVDCAREITAAKRDCVRYERRNYLQLKEYTSYEPQDGEE
jgi:hypothetical protein